MIKNILFIIVLGISSGLVKAQDNRCRTVFTDNWETPEFNIARLQTDIAGKSSAVHNVPVVFHVIHKGGSENIADTAVLRILDQFNKRLANQGQYNDPDGVDVGIQLCLASYDPNGNFTNGITHDYHEGTHFENYISDNNLPFNYNVSLLLANLYGWPSSNYLNVYIVLNCGAQADGFASLPNYHGQVSDGMFLSVSFLSYSYPFDILMHHFGHYLGLYHTYYGMPCVNNDCLNDNDKVCDTPPDNQAAAPGGCTVNSCTTDEDDISLNNPFRSTTLGGLGDQNDFTHNYLDAMPGAYSCASRFTTGQKARMTAGLTTMRASLLSSLGCTPTSASSSIKNTVMSVYPNPANEVLYIETTFSKYDLSLINTLGQVVYLRRGCSSKQAIDVESLVEGVYYLRVETADREVVNKKVVVGP